MHQPVLVYAQIHKRAKGGYVADCAFKHHAFLQVGNVFYAFVKAGYDKVGTRVAAGFFELGQDVFYGDNAKLGAGKLLGLELFEHFGTPHDLRNGFARSSNDLLHHRVGFGVYACHI